MRGFLFVLFVVFWAGIAALSFLGAPGPRPPAATFGAIVGTNIVGLIGSAVALGFVARALARGKRPVTSLIVVALLASWSAWRVPDFWTFMCRSMQVEAKYNLAHLDGGGAFDAMPARERHYRFVALDDGAGFAAIGVGEMEGDEWHIAPGARPVAISNVCSPD